MLTETDIFYYIALAIVFFIIMYVIYISLHFQNNVIESFSIGGGKDKKEKKTKESKAVETIEQQNTVLEDVLNITDNKKDYDDILTALKRKINLITLQFVIHTSGASDLDKLSGALAGLKHAHDGIDELIAFVDKE
jgi:hypothetical protein